MAQWTTVPEFVGVWLNTSMPAGVGRWIGDRFDLMSSLTLGVAGVWTIDQVAVIDFTASSDDTFASLRVGTTGRVGTVIAKGNGTDASGQLEARSADNMSFVFTPPTTAAFPGALTYATQSAQGIWTIPDTNGNAGFLMTVAAQTITGAKTFASSALKLQEVSSTDVVTIAVAALAASRTYTVIDAGAAADFLMTAGAQTITGAKTFASSALLLQEAGSTDVITVVVASLAAGRSYTLPDAGGAAEFVMSAGSSTIAGTKTFSSALATSAGVGTVAGTNITVSELGDGALHKTVFTLTAHSITITDAAAAGAHGTTAFYTFPEGHIKIIGGHIVLTSIAAGAGGIDDDAELDIGIGTAAVGVDNDELATTEQDILLINEKALVAGAATGDAKMGLTNVQIDGSAAAGTLNLNVAVDADDVGASDTLTVTGTITIFWIHEGDD